MMPPPKRLNPHVDASDASSTPEVTTIPDGGIAALPFFASLGATEADSGHRSIHDAAPGVHPTRRSAREASLRSLTERPSSARVTDSPDAVDPPTNFDAGSAWDTWASAATPSFAAERQVTSSRSTQSPRHTQAPHTAEEPSVAQRAGDVDWDVVHRLRGAVSSLLTDALRVDPGMSEDEQRANAQAHISEVIRDHVDEQIRIGGAAAAWSPTVRTRMARAIFDALFKLGRLQPLVDDPSVENIDIYGHDNVWVSYADGSRRRHGEIARTDAELIADIAFLAQRGGEDGRSFTPSTPILDMDLPGNARLAAVHPPISPRPKVVVRIHRFVDIDLDALVREHDSLSASAADFLEAAIRAGLSVVVAGAPGAGKTTLVRALANCIPPHEEIVTIEKERELHLDRMGDRHHIVTPLQYRPGQGEASGDGRRAGEITLVDLLEEALRLNAERIIVGEVRGGEIDAMFQAMQAGVGSLSTIHAHSPTDAIERLAGLTLKSLGTTDAYAYRQITRHIDLIVQIRRVRDSLGRVRRVVTHIAEVQPGEEGRDGVTRPIAADIFARSATSDALVPVSLPMPRTLTLLAEHGFEQSSMRPSAPAEVG